MFSIREQVQLIISLFVPCSTITAILPMGDWRKKNNNVG